MSSCPPEFAVRRSPTALPASESPMIATVGPMITGGMSLLSQLTPALFTTRAMITYTSPANSAPRMIPAKPAATEIAPANAVDIEPKKANDEPRKTGLFFAVKSTYTRVPTPAPNRAAPMLMLTSPTPS